jgi:hypothetical protein
MKFHVPKALLHSNAFNAGCILLHVKVHFNLSNDVAYDTDTYISNTV